MTEVAPLTTALLFGGMALYLFRCAAFVFNALPAKTAGPLTQRAFPHFSFLRWAPQQQQLR